MSKDIYITSIDKERIEKFLNKMLDKPLKKLEYEINRAIVVTPQQISGDVITMNSRVLLQLDDEDMEISLVYPADADMGAAKVSIFSPIGTAIIGYRVGDIIEWEVPSGTSKIYIKRILYQPEASGNYLI